jgi:hypothetical protein
VSGLRDQLQAIHDQHGRLTPELVVQVARPKSHPLHDRVFDREPREAAEAWYRQRAHELIQSVRVVYREGDDAGPERSVRAFHAVRREDGYAYEPVEKVVEDEFTRSLLLRDMEREWKQLYARFEQFEEFLSMVANDVTARLAA